jgi:amino acid transporter
VPFFYQREHGADFNVIQHIIIPAIPFIVLAVVLYFQFAPVPPPLNLALPITAAWLVLGIVVVIFLSLRAPEALARSSKVYIEE